MGVLSLVNERVEISNHIFVVSGDFHLACCCSFVNIDGS